MPRTGAPARCDFEAAPPPGVRVLLDLSRVCETAGVRANGAAASAAWMRPYELDITRWLRPGRNRLRVDLINLFVNSAWLSLNRK